MHYVLNMSVILLSCQVRSQSSVHTTCWHWGLTLRDISESQLDS